jgi:uncharacterized membrane protein YfcA
MPTEATQDLVVPLAVVPLLLLLLLQPATASAPTAAVATITLDFMGTPSLAIQSAVDQTIALCTRAREGF